MFKFIKFKGNRNRVGTAHVTIEFIKDDVAILPDFISDIKWLEETGKKVVYDYVDPDRPVKIALTDGRRFPSGREYWRHDHTDYPILLEERPCLVKLPDNLFEV